MQEEIKITSVTIFVNPYTEPDEEEEEKAKAEEKAEDEDNVCYQTLKFVSVLFSTLFHSLQ